MKKENFEKAKAAEEKLNAAIKGATERKNYAVEQATSDLAIEVGKCLDCNGQGRIERFRYGVAHFVTNIPDAITAYERKADDAINKMNEEIKTAEREFNAEFARL